MKGLTAKEAEARKRVCLALDGLATLEDVKTRVQELSPVVGLFKIGKESYTRFGPKVVQLVKEHGAQVFLDLKYHDIPNTVYGAAEAAAGLGVYMFNVHASGGLAMLEAALEGAKAGSVSAKTLLPKVIAVTVLTSIDQTSLNEELSVNGSVEEHVLHLAQLTAAAGLNGIVCSATELRAIRDKLPRDFIYVTPGIKGPKTKAGADQKRVFTPGNAVSNGSTILVIGRAITAANSAEARLRAGYQVLEDMAKEL